MKTIVPGCTSRSMPKLLAPLMVVLALFASLAIPQTAHAIGPVCRVDPAAAAGGDGATWFTAINSLQTAIGNTACTEIWVKAGVYMPGMARSSTFLVSRNVSIYGGFAGTESSLSQRNPAAHVTILSGDIDGNDTNTDGNHIDEVYGNIQGNNSYHVVTVNGGVFSIWPTLDGFIITGGMADNEAWPPFDRGGGLYCVAGSGGKCKPKLTNLTFSGNAAFFAGGALFNEVQGSSTSSPEVSHVTFSGNAAQGYGGAVFNNGYDGISSPTFTDVTFKGNLAGRGGAVAGRGIGDTTHLGYSDPVFTNVTFSANIALMGDGGAMWSEARSTGLSESKPVLTNVILWGDTGSNGREIYNKGSALPIINFSIVQGGDSGIGGDGGLTAFSSGFENINADPLLSPLGSYGGFTKTMPLKLGSPAIDHGTNTGCPSTDQRGLPRPKDGDGNGTKICDMGATESSRVTVKLQSTGKYDGWVLESGENTSVGGSHDATATAFYLGDDAANEQYRAVLSFNTAPIPDSATLAAATLKIRKFAQVGANPFGSLGNIIVDLKKGAFGTGPALENGDFQAAATKSGVAAITNSPSSTGWYTKALASTSLAYVNKAGITQLRLRFATDDNNNHVADYLKFYSGNYGTASSRPQLVIAYYVP